MLQPFGKFLFVYAWLLMILLFVIFVCYLGIYLLRKIRGGVHK